MDTLHTMLRAISTETKNKRDHLSVFREFLAHLGKIQHKAPLKSARAKSPPRRKPAKRSRKG